MASTQAETVELRIPCDPKYILVARLVTGGVGTRAGLTIDDIDDLKVAVSEACTNVTDHAFTNSDKLEGPATIVLRFTPRQKALQVEVEDYGAGFDPEQIHEAKPGTGGTEGGLGLYLIRQLTDELEIQSAPGSGTKLIMTKRLTE